MKKHIFLFCALFFAFGSMAFSQEQSAPDDTADSIYLKCLHEHKHFLSTNLLQIVVGTANINYEYNITKRLSLKVGAGTVLGYRISSNDYENCVPGGLYYIVEPRIYSYASTKNCWMQYGFSFAYKYWEYKKNQLVDNPIYIAGNTSVDQYIYKEIDVVEQLGSVSFFGKHPVASGFTFEYQAGLGAGVKSSKFLVSPNVSFSIGWTL